MISYWTRLTLRLAAGIAQLDPTALVAANNFVRSQLAKDGGFCGRKRHSEGDLYYTSFGVRLLSLLEMARGSTVVCELAPTTDFLRRAAAAQPPRDSIDVLSLAMSAMVIEATTGEPLLTTNIATWTRTTLAPWCEVTGGVRTSPEASSWSTYQTFLATTLWSFWETDAPRVSVEMVLTRQRDDGGFVELAPLRHSGTNPTAAAIGLLAILSSEVVSPEVVPHNEAAKNAAAFLASQQMNDGGFRAHARIPASDLLSTFTAIVALSDLNALATCDTAAALRFVQSCRARDGGYTGGPWESTSDAEYTFYGLGAEAILAVL